MSGHNQSQDSNSGKGLSLEEKFEQLEDIVKRMEEQDISLEESFQSYQAGMELLRQCNADLDKVEKQVMALAEDGEAVPFE